MYEHLPLVSRGKPLISISSSRPTWRRSYLITDRIICTTRILCFSSRAGIPNHDDNIGGLCCSHKTASRPNHGKRPLVTKLAKGF
jgi:hypothetical protein